MRTILILFISILLVYACKDDNPVDPPDDDESKTCEYPPGNRDFTWRTDTVAWFPSTLGGVWAFSDTNAYVMGRMFEGKPPYGFYVGLHWNGEKWERDINGEFSEIMHYPIDVTGDDFYMVTAGYWDVGEEKPGIGEFDNRTKKWSGYQFNKEGSLRAVWTDGNGFFVASGDNGMVYIKESYSSGWEYSKAPTDFHLNGVTGVSKNELYFLGYKSISSGENFDQIWKYYEQNWIKLFDSQDTIGNHLEMGDHSVGDIEVVRCQANDSLKLYVIGWESYLFESHGQELEFKKTNLSELGLPLRQNRRSGLDINLYSPNDYWVFGTRYNFYHWNGNNFQKVVIPGLPNNDMQFGFQQKMVKTDNGKLFLPTEVSSQVYVVVQGTP